MLVKSRPRISRIPVVALVLFLGTVFSRATLADHACPDGNLLAGKLPADSTAIIHPERLTDGVAAIEGDGWQSDLVGTVPSDAALIYDLGHPVRVRSAFLQGDHRGPFVIEGSADGQNWFELWTTSGRRWARPSIPNHVRARPCRSISPGDQSSTARSLRTDRHSDLLQSPRSVAHRNDPRRENGCEPVARALPPTAGPSQAQRRDARWHRLLVSAPYRPA